MKPYFRSLEKLKQFCRLGESSVNADVFIEEALLEFEVTAIDILGQSDWDIKVSEKTDSKCKLAEAKFVKAYLMQQMPTLFVDSDVSAQSILEDEALTRESDPTSDLIKSMKAEAIQLLESAKTQTPVSSVKSAVLGTPSDTYYTVFDSFEEGRNL